MNTECMEDNEIMLGPFVSRISHNMPMVILFVCDTNEYIYGFLRASSFFVSYICKNYVKELSPQS